MHRDSSSQVVPGYINDRVVLKTRNKCRVLDIVEFHYTDIHSLRSKLNSYCILIYLGIFLFKPDMFSHSVFFDFPS